MRNVCWYAFQGEVGAVEVSLRFEESHMPTLVVLWEEIQAPYGRARFQQKEEKGNYNTGIDWE